MDNVNVTHIMGYYSAARENEIMKILGKSMVESGGTGGREREETGIGM